MAGEGSVLWPGLGRKRGECPEDLHLEIGGGTAVRAGGAAGSWLGPRDGGRSEDRSGEDRAGWRGVAQKWGALGVWTRKAGHWVQ